MPNWVNNFLSIQTKDLDKVVNKENEVDFNILVPMPKELENTISGGHIDDCMAYAYLKEHTLEEFQNTFQRYLYREDSFKGKSKEDCLNEMLDRIGNNPIMYNSEFGKGERLPDGTYKPKQYGHTPEEIGKYYLELKEKYGKIDWYDWSCANWGCKWNASDTSINEPYFIDGVEFVDIQFSTPWGAPAGWLETLSKEIPFYLAWEEEQGYRGIYYNDCEGNLLEEDLPELEWKEDEESGEYYQVEDEYGEFWVDYFKEDMLKDNMNFSKEDLEKEDIEEERA